MLPAFLRPATQTAPTPARTLRQALGVVGLAYASSLLGYALVRRLGGPRAGWAELIDDLEPWAYTPAPALAALGTAAGSRGLAASTLAACGLWGLRWGRRYLRAAPGQPGARPPAALTVMTFNTLAWQREGHDLEHSILSAAPDIVALQEIGPRAAHYLANKLATLFPYQYITESADSSGAAVLSRYPLRETVAFKASEKGHWWQRMIVDLPADPITFLNVHTKIPYVRTTHRRKWLPRIPLSFHSQRRNGEVKHLISLIKKVDGPLIVCGDFNMTERSGDYARIASLLTDAYRAVGRGLGHTFPRAGSWPHNFAAPWPVLRLDYVWLSEHFGAAWAYRGEAGRSDHHPIVVGLRWAEISQPLSPSLPLAASTV
jgi:endonuclease/exonuclease/phosphatase (EEP) superfamily protein YafD